MQRRIRQFLQEHNQEQLICHTAKLAHKFVLRFYWHYIATGLKVFHFNKYLQGIVTLHVLLIPAYIIYYID